MWDKKVFDTTLNIKVPRSKRRADFLFHNGMFRHKVVANKNLYNRRKEKSSSKFYEEY